MHRKHKVCLLGASLALFILLVSTASLGVTTPIAELSYERNDTELRFQSANILAADPPPGMISYWKIDDGHAEVVVDSIDSNHGRAEVVWHWVAGVSGTALDLRPTGYVDCGGDSSLSLSTTGFLTIEAWVKVDTFTSLQTIVQNGDPTSKMYHFALQNGFLYFDQDDGTPQSVNTVTQSDLRVTPRQWNHVVVMLDTHSPGTVTFYLNGNSQLVPYHDVYNGGDLSRFLIGYGQNPLRGYEPAFLGGTIDEVAVYNETLSREDIQRHYQNGLAGLGYLEGPTQTPPVATDDAYATDEDVPLSVVAPGVLANDVDDDGDPLEAILETGPSHGTLTLNVDGSFDYIPDSDFNGIDTFMYKAFDGTFESNIATVTIEVLPVNDAPLADDDNYPTNEDVPLSVPAPGVLNGDTDVENDPLTAFLDTGPAHGMLVFNADGSFFYTPDPDFFGTDTFTYMAYDGGIMSNIATVTIDVIAVNDAPVGVDDSYTIDEDTSLDLTAPGLLGNDSDIEGDTITLIVVTVPSHGSGSIGADGSFSYTPNQDWYGTDSMTYEVYDGADYSGIVIVTITVNPVNDAPVAVDDYVVTDEDTPVIIDFMANDYDVDDTFDWAQVQWNPTEINGELELVHNYEVSPGVFRTVIQYTPDSNWHGSSSSISYGIRDSFGEQSTAQIYLTVNSVNDVPVAVDDYVVTDENTPVIIDFMANDYDIEGDSIDWSWMGYSNLDLHGQISRQQMEVEPGVFRTVIIYTPDTNWYGSTSTVRYGIRDSLGGESLTAWIHITVNPANEPPLANDDAYSTEAGVPIVVEAPGVLANDVDINGDSLEALRIDMPMHGTVALNSDGSFTYTPDAAWCGVDTFTYYAFDGLEYSNIAVVTITVVDVTPPVTTIHLSGVAGEYGWYHSDVEVTLSAIDDCSGVESTVYSLDGLTWILCIDPFVLTDAGEYAIQYYSIDLAGNVEDTKIATVKISMSTYSYASGAGRIEEADGCKGFFVFGVKYKSTRGLRGFAMYFYREPGYRYVVKCSQWFGMVIDGNHAILEGKCTIKLYNYEAKEHVYLRNFYVRIEVWDNGKGHSDVFQIQIFDEDGELFHEAGFDPPGNVLCGNIRVYVRIWRCWCWCKDRP